MSPAPLAVIASRVSGAAIQENTVSREAAKARSLLDRLSLHDFAPSREPIPAFPAEHSDTSGAQS